MVQVTAKIMKPSTEAESQAGRGTSGCDTGPSSGDSCQARGGVETGPGPAGDGHGERAGSRRCWLPGIRSLSVVRTAHSPPVRSVQVL